MNQQPIYLDYMATTPVDTQVKDAMFVALDQDGIFGNPSSLTHFYGKTAQGVVENARAQVADLLNANPKAIVWTSGATEANNLALIGAASAYGRARKHIISLSTEHKSVLNTLKELEKRGFRVTYLDPNPDGLLDLKTFQSAICEDTILASVMFVNNETGVIQDIAGIAAIAKEHGILLHVDAVQAAGKIPIDLSTLPVDLMSFSAHKIYGPKGVGALYVRQAPRVRLTPQSYGGGQEHRGLRSGTLATHQIAGMGRAFLIAKERLEKDYAHLIALRDRLLDGLTGLDIICNTPIEHAIPGCLSVTFNGIDGEQLLSALPGLAISTGSACGAGNISPSHVLRALKLSPEAIHSTLRISMGRFTTCDQIDRAVRLIREAARIGIRD